MTQHPITPPPELVQEWKHTAPNLCNAREHYYYITLCAARWGADQELEACLKWMGSFCATWTCGRRPEDLLRAARRPKPLSRKEQALEAIGRLCASVIHDDLKNDAAIVRRALEQLPDAL